MEIPGQISAEIDTATAASAKAISCAIITGVAVLDAQAAFLIALYFILH